MGADALLHFPQRRFLDRERCITAFHLDDKRIARSEIRSEVEGHFL
jgi:hypothetical protein